MYSSCLHFLHRRHPPTSNFLTNSGWSNKLQYSFVNGSPTNGPSLKYFHTNLLVPNQIKSPSCLKKKIHIFPIAFSTYRQRPNKYICKKQPQKHGSQRLGRDPYRNHMTSNGITGSWRCNNAISPKVASPTNQTITLLITPEHTSNCLNAQRNNHSQRNPRSPEFSFSCIVRSIKYSNLNTKTISTSQSSYSHQNKMTVSCSCSRSCPRKFQNSIFTIISSKERPSQ